MNTTMNSNPSRVKSLPINTPLIFLNQIGMIMLFILLSILTSCSEDDAFDTFDNIDQNPISDTDNTSGVTTNSSDCADIATLDASRGECSVTLSWNPEVSIEQNGSEITIRSNGIPDHEVGTFGGGAGSLNPNAISEQSDIYTVSANPAQSGNTTWLFDPNGGPEYIFGVLLNGVKIDPEAAEPWPHTRPVNFNTANWAWNLDAMAINLGLDCNNAHVQPTGAYHYHGAPTLYLQGINANTNEMTMVGYAGDGFPIYHKYGHSDPNSTQSQVKSLQSSYRLKSGERPGNGTDAPCGSYTGIYTADYEFVEGLGDLDECNGRVGATPEYPDGIYYYVVTDSYPYVGRCLVGSVSSDFRLRG